MSNFYKLNQEYIKQFQQRILSRYRDYDKRSETALFKSLLEEVNELFRKLGKHVSSKTMLPDPTDYPDSKVYNQLLNDIGFDINKLYNAQKLIESDINNLINFNSSQRSKTLENLTSAQQEVYSAYVKSKRDVLGGVEVPVGNPFTSSDNLSTESKDVYIDQIRQVLTLSSDSTVDREVDVSNISVYFAGKSPEGSFYPGGDTFGIGSHWKQSSSDPHFIDSKDLSKVKVYKTMMIDDPNNSMSVGFCEFEAVKTILDYDGVLPLKEEVGKIKNLDTQNVYLDITNSMQGEYIDYEGEIISSKPSDSVPKYKLVIPFTSNLITDEIIVDLSANAGAVVPKVVWEESKVYSQTGGTDTAYPVIPPQNSSTDGKYSCHIANFIVPSRLELMLQYEGDEWIPIDFYMSYYVYSDTISYKMPAYGDNILNVTIKKSYDIFVDAEANETNEKARALNVLGTPNRSS